MLSCLPVNICGQSAVYCGCSVMLQSMSGACLFLAAKVEEQPRKLEHVIRTGYMCTHREQPPLDVKSDVSAVVYSLSFFEELSCV